MSPAPVAVRWIIRLLLLAHCALLAANVSLGAPPTRDEVRQRIRAELANQLGEKPESLGFDKPVTSFGTDELDIIEWVLAVEEAFQISIRDEMLVDAKTKTVRADLSIDLLTEIACNLLEAKTAPKSTKTTWRSCPAPSAVSAPAVHGGQWDNA